MWNKLAKILLPLCLIGGLPSQVFASDILDEIEKTGVIKAGYRLSEPKWKID